MWEALTPNRSLSPYDQGSCDCEPSASPLSYLPTTPVAAIARAMYIYSKYFYKSLMAIDYRFRIIPDHDVYIIQFIFRASADYETVK